jgi:hypothetical protein
MTARDQEEQDLRIELMKLQMALTSMRQIRRQMIRPLAAFAAVTLVLCGVIFAIAEYLHPTNQQPGTVITIPPAKP